MEVDLNLAKRWLVAWAPLVREASVGLKKV